MTRDLKEHIFDIVDRSGRGLTVTAVAEALAKDMTDEIGALLNALAEENRVRKNPAGGGYSATYHHIPQDRRF